MHAGKVCSNLANHPSFCTIDPPSLDGVIRAYVHTDYSSFNPAQHTARKQQPGTSKLAITPSHLSDPADQASSGSITPTNKRPIPNGADSG